MVGEFDLSAELMLSLFCVMALAIISKLLFFKERPVRQEKNNIIERIDASSFPSIHSMRVSSLVFWLSLYFNNVIMTCYFAVIGLMVVYSRVFLKKHFIIDVIFGIIFSIVINMLLWWFI